MSATAHKLRKALTTNSTATSFTAKTPRTSAPSGDGVFDLRAGSSLGVGLGNSTPSYIQIVPYAVASDNHTFDFRLWSWGETTDAQPIYIPTLLVDVSVTIGNISGTNIESGALLADTLVINAGAGDGAFRSLISTADDTPASLLVHLRGARLLEFDWDLTSAATSMNAMIRFVD